RGRAASRTLERRLQRPPGELHGSSSEGRERGHRLREWGRRDHGRDCRGERGEWERQSSRERWRRSPRLEWERGGEWRGARGSRAGVEWQRPRGRRDLTGTGQRVEREWRRRGE